MTFEERARQGIVLFDGAMGTEIQKLDLTDAEWGQAYGCSEILNVTAPGRIVDIHSGYLEAGSDVVETNSFGASRTVLAEYGLEERIVEINRAAARLARQACQPFQAAKPRFVAGSIGPGTKLISLGQIDYPAMYDSYAQAARGLLEGAVDLFIVETCQDLLQIKVALHALSDVMEKENARRPVIVSVTVETTGTLLVGSELEAVRAALEPFGLFALGLNCATGPEAMRPYIRQLAASWEGRLVCQPNAGIPHTEGGKMVYPLSVEEYVQVMSGFIREDGVTLVGGCCGTTPGFIRALAAGLPGLRLAARQPVVVPAVSSLFSAQSLKQDPGPFIVGERTNTNGSRAFRDTLLRDDWDGLVEIAREQAGGGSHAIDLCVAYTGRDESADMREALRRIVTRVNLPVFIDSTDPQVLDQALRLYGGRAVINSINLEDGEGRAHALCRLARRYGAALVALTIDERGMAREVAQKVAIARRIYDIAVGRHGLRPQDLIYDALTFTLGSGDETMKDAGIKTLEGIRAIKQALPGVFTLLGVSNISFGLSPASRDVLNSVFLAEAVAAGLDLAIVNGRAILPLYRIEPADRDVALNLIYNRGENPLFAFIGHFEAKAGTKRETEEREDLPLPERLQNRIVHGSRARLRELLEEALGRYSALDIINDHLIPAMRVVGDLFGSGKMQLPFVLQSAEVMKAAVDILQPYLEKKSAAEEVSIVLATVRGDVHDIGKNLVDIILTNNGYRVYNLGIKCEIDTMMRKAEEVGATAIGMSGLLVKSTLVMKENLEEMERRGLALPVLLGGAALTPAYVDDTCAAVYRGPVAYCADAFEGLRAMGQVKEGALEEELARLRSRKREAPKPLFARVKPEEMQPIRRDVDIPQAPFWGSRIVTGIDLDTVFSFLTEPVLFRGRWGYRRGSLSREEFERLIEETVRPEFEALKTRCKAQGLLAPAVVYGYWPANGQGEQVIIFEPGTDRELARFTFPRQMMAPYRCIADYFLPLEAGRRDLIVLQVATVGSPAAEESRRLYAANAYKEYLLFHGLSVESAEALAEYWHLVVRRELGITEEEGKSIEDYVVQKYRGSRYSFGYPACPDLSENRKIFQLLAPERIGVTLTEGDQMVPEQTTSAFITHHPQAKYFTT
jgi:5-methyltetrahydrofolate--homocysteine methyltransferase